MSDAPIFALVGATATGKTDLAEALADRLDAEIVCLDSRQVFRELDAGTGKPDAAARAARPHHLFDALSIDERPSAGWYAREAARVIGDVRARGRRPLLVGGAGLYLRALREGLAEEPVLDPAARDALRREHAAMPLEDLHARLAARDPAAAAKLRPRDRQRISRALEVIEATGGTLAEWQARGATPAVTGEWRVVEVRIAAAALARRIEARTRWMFEHGLLEETRALLAAGREESLRRLCAVGYDEALALLAGTMTRPDAERRTNERTRQLAKRQRTWFRHQVKAVVVQGEDPAARSRLVEALGGANEG